MRTKRVCRATSRTTCELGVPRSAGLPTIKDWESSPILPVTRVSPIHATRTHYVGKPRSSAPGRLLRTIEMEHAVPHNFSIYIDHDGHDTWVATGKGLGWADRRGILPRSARQSGLVSRIRGAGSHASSTADQARFTMIHRFVIAFLLCVVIASVNFRVPKRRPVHPPSSIDDQTQAVLDEIDSLNAYQVPQLPLKSEDRYANTPDEVRPHGHVEPYKRHFLLQMEYTGPGRAIPEPEDLTSVKIGFLGPIERTVSVATGGMSHEEYLGIPMLYGAQLAIEHANAQGGYLKRTDSV